MSFMIHYNSGLFISNKSVSTFCSKFVDSQGLLKSITVERDYIPVPNTISFDVINDKLFLNVAGEKLIITRNGSLSFLRVSKVYDKITDILPYEFDKPQLFKLYPFVALVNSFLISTDDELSKLMTRARELRT